MSRKIQQPPSRHTLLYDGDCAFCHYCVDYLALVTTGKAVDYQPYQQQLSRFPELSAEQCRSSIQWLQPDGSAHQGAAAAFLAMERGGRPGWWHSYRWLPGFALLCEWLYRWVANHRPFVFRMTRLLVGDSLQPLRYERVHALFLRLFALIYFAALLSCALQQTGLYGSQGIIPLSLYLPSLGLDGEQRWLSLPTVFWFSQADWFQLAVPLVGMAASVLVFFRLLPTTNLIVAWLTYLSLVNAGPVFMQFQWDILLLEAGFIAIILQQNPLLGVWLYRWLLFRFMWLSGWVKITSGDPMWTNWTALTVHFETQPLPTVFAWYAHHLPELFLRAATAMTLFIEIVLPLFIFLPRRLRLLAFWSFALLESLILVTGNYNFFNILTISISLFLLDDRLLEQLLPTKLQPKPLALSPGCTVRGRLCTAIAILVLMLSINLFYLAVQKRRPAAWQYDLLVATRAFHLTSNYGVFAVMTRQRPQIIIEHSEDGQHWQPYSLRFQATDLQQAPRWVAPLQPRLDWQLWFAALKPTPPQWFNQLLLQLLLGSPPVERLLGYPETGDGPPRFVRALRYRYQFTTPEQRAATGNWWTRTYEDEYHAPMRIVMEPSDQSEELREIPEQFQ